MKRWLLFSSTLILSVSTLFAETAREVSEEDVAELVSLVLNDMPAADEKVRYDTLTDEDFKLVADQLGVEVAAIKAVVKIEAGEKLQGFWAPGVPVVNYEQSLFNKYNGKNKGRKIKDAKVPSGLSGYALKEWTSLTNARKINADAADMGTYWGMFQIGGFNYKLCGCQSVEEMVRKICDSEFSQLEMFAVFIRNSGMVESLQKKDWASFARKYNGPSYAKRGYHTRMANEYAKFKKKEAENATGTKADEKKTPQVKSGVDQKPAQITEKKAEPTKNVTARKKSRRKKTKK